MSVTRLFRSFPASQFKEDAVRLSGDTAHAHQQAISVFPMSLQRAATERSGSREHQWPIMIFRRWRKRVFLVPFCAGKMAVFRSWRWLPGARLEQFIHSEASAAPSDDLVASPASLYPPVVASLTAKSKIAKLRRREEYYKSIHNAPTVEEKLAIYGKRQRLKYVVYPQTWALNADRWYQHFTKTVFVPGLPASVSVSEEDKKDSLDLAELRSLVCEVLLQEHYYQRKKRPKLFRISDQGPAPFITHLVPKLAAHLACLNPALGSSSIVGVSLFVLV